MGYAVTFKGGAADCGAEGHEAFCQVVSQSPNVLGSITGASILRDRVESHFMGVTSIIGFVPNRDSDDAQNARERALAGQINKPKGVSLEQLEAKAPKAVPKTARKIAKKPTVRSAHGKKLARKPSEVIAKEVCLV